MKKLLALVLALCLTVSAVAAFAEEDIADYLDSHPEAAAYVSAWAAEDGDWRIEFYNEDGGIKTAVYHRLGDNLEDI